MMVNKHIKREYYAELLHKISDHFNEIGEPEYKNIFNQKFRVFIVGEMKKYNKNSKDSLLKMNNYIDQVIKDISEVRKSKKISVIKDVNKNSIDKDKIDSSDEEEMNPFKKMKKGKYKRNNNKK